jgi:hypothetical protein
MSEWRHKRYGVSCPRSFFEKLQRSYDIVTINKLPFFLLLLLYFIAETIGNAGLLIFQWTLDSEAPHSSQHILVQLTANWPAGIWRSLLNACLLNVVLKAMKRRGKELLLSDILGIRSLFGWKLFLSMFLTDVVLATPLAIAQALFSSDFVWAITYAVFGLVLNWLFGMAQILLFEDPSLSILSCFIWSAAMSFNPTYFSGILTSYIGIFITTPLVVTTPFLLVLQILLFFEVFGYASPSEVYHSSHMQS